jgi:hypothetical protein
MDRNIDWIIASGSFCLGSLVGALVAWFVSESEKLDQKILAGSISAIVGSSVLAMFSFLAGMRGPTHEYWFYPIGLLVGFSFIACIEIWYWGYDGNKRKRRRD